MQSKDETDAFGVNMFGNISSAHTQVSNHVRRENHVGRKTERIIFPFVLCRVKQSMDILVGVGSFLVRLQDEFRSCYQVLGGTLFLSTVAAPGMHLSRRPLNTVE